MLLAVMQVYMWQQDFLCRQKPLSGVIFPNPRGGGHILAWGLHWVCRRLVPFPHLLRCWLGLFIPCSSSWNCCEGAKACRSLTLSKAGLKVIVKTINNKVQTAGLYVM